MRLTPPNAALDHLVARALASRAELKQSRAGLAAARYENKQVVYGPSAPTLKSLRPFSAAWARPTGVPHRFGESEDYTVALGWRLGPGGFLRSRPHPWNQARLQMAALAEEKVRDEIIRAVVESQGRIQSLVDQLAVARGAAKTAEELLGLTQQRKEFGVGAVLEDIQAQQEATQARLDLVNIVIEYNKAQVRSAARAGRPWPVGHGARTGQRSSCSPAIRFLARCSTKNP